jgi:hypothetical protein
MPLSSLLFLIVSGVLMTSVALVGARSARTRQARAAQELAQRRQRLWGSDHRDASVDLLARRRVVFVAIPGWSQRLDHRLEDSLGTEIGTALEQPRPRRWAKNGRRSRFSTVCIEVDDCSGARRLKIVRPSGVRWAPLEVFDSGGSLVGTIARTDRRHFVVRDAGSAAVARIERRSRGHAVDYRITDEAGAEVARIVDFRHLDDREPSESLWLKFRRAAYDTAVAEEHVLDVEPTVSRELRPLLLAAAAAVYLAFQAPFEDGA